MADTLAFPPEGSPDRLSDPTGHADAQARGQGSEPVQGWPALFRRRKEQATTQPVPPEN